MSKDYFSPLAEEMPLLHTWSIVVEEQYYLLFPVVLALLFKVNRRVLGTLLILFTVLSYFAILQVNNHIGANFYLIINRTWELMICSYAVYKSFHNYGSTLLKYHNQLSAVAMLMVFEAIIN